jgi:DUF4097 and DUF4098 domain-containing protein YvlB
MNLTIKITTLLLAAALSASAASEEKIHETRPAKAGGKLVVDVDFGTISVAAGDSDKVVVDAYRKVEASSKEKEQEYLAAAPITITTEGDTIVVRARRKNNSLGSQLWNLLGHTTTKGRYTVRVPATFNTDLQTAGGDVSADGLTGTIKVSTSGGDLNFERVHGPIDAETSGGDITVTACEGALDVETSGGRIEATGGSGSLRAQTSGGAVTVANFAGDTRVESSGGRIRLANISGKLSGETSGGAIDAILSSPVAGDVRLETSAGAIRVLAPANAALTLDAETGAGDVTSDFPTANTRASRDSLKGTINGGGSSLHLRSSAGAISIKSSSEAAQL